MNAGYMYQNFKGVFVRAIFIFHALLSIHMIHLNNNFKSIHYLLFLPPACLLCEGLYVIYVKNGAEMEFFWTSGFLYIASVVPVVWIIEMGLLQKRQVSISPREITTTLFGGIHFTTLARAGCWSLILRRLSL